MDRSTTTEKPAAEASADRPTPKRRWLPMLLDILVAVAVFFAGYGTHMWQTTRQADQTAAQLAACGISGNGGARPQSWSELKEVGFPASFVSWTNGKAGDGKVQVGVILDYQCPYSQKFIQDILPRLIERQDVYLEVYDLPLDFHENAIRAAAGAHCADNQGRAVEFIETLIQLDPGVGMTDEAAESVGLEMEEYSLCASATESYVKSNAEKLAKAGIYSTPSMIIDGRLLEGLNDWETVAKFIDDAAASR